MKYNLLEEKWIKCHMVDGSHQEFSLMDVIEQACLIECFEFDHPLSNESVFRLVLIIVARANKDIDRLKYQEMWEKGILNADDIKCYLEKFYNRFDLLDNEYPFFQDACLDDEKNIKKVAYLFDDRDKGENAIYLDHRINNAVTAKEAAIALLSKQMFSISNGPLSYSVGMPVCGSCFAVEGNTVFETIMLNWIVSGKNKLSGTPSWEYSACDYSKPFSDQLDYFGMMTLLVKRIKLIVDDSTGLVNNIYICDGKSLARGKNKEEGILMKDYFHVWKTNKKGERKRFYINKNTTWQQYASILKYSDEGVNAIENIKNMVECGTVGKNTKWNLKMYGVDLGEMNCKINYVYCVDNYFVVDVISKLNGDDKDKYFALTENMVNYYKKIIDKVDKEIKFDSKKKNIKQSVFSKFKSNVKEQIGILARERFYGIMLDDVINKDVEVIEQEWKDYLCAELKRILDEQLVSCFYYINEYIDLVIYCDNIMRSYHSKVKPRGLIGTIKD